MNFITRQRITMCYTLKAVSKDYVTDNVSLIKIRFVVHEL